MTPEELINSIFASAPTILIKLLAILLLLMHLAFSFVLLRQTKLMIRIVEAKISPTIYAIAIAHLIASIFVIVWTIIFL